MQQDFMKTKPIFTTGAVHVAAYDAVHAGKFPLQYY